MANSWPKWKRRAAHIKERLDAGATIQELANEYDVSPKSITNRIGELKADGLLDAKQVGQQIPNDTEVEIMSNGTHKSRKLIEMSEEQSKDPDYLLKAHGYSVEDWELVNSKSKIWNVYSKLDKVQTLYSSSITVKPLVDGMSIEHFAELIKASVQPLTIERTQPKPDTHSLLEIPLYDLHMGMNSYEQYKDVQSGVNELITSRGWEQILFIIGSDLFHHDNFRSTTASGTRIEDVDMEAAWKDATSFYVPLIKSAIENSASVFIMYSKGNHSESMSWAFVQYLEALFPVLQFDDRFIERKVHLFHQVFIGVTHGDKARKDLIRIFPAEFPIEWSKAAVRECHIGHLHREDEIRGKDEFGMTVRTLATKNKTDAWHNDNGYVTAHKRFQLFEYSQDALRCIHYV